MESSTHAPAALSHRHVVAGTLAAWGDLAYDNYGSSGPTVVLLHGIPGSRATFAAVGERLGKTCRVVVPDLLGFGDSPDAPDHYHAEEHAEVVVQFLAKLGIEDFHLVGFDFGGPTAIRLAAKLGQRVRSLTVAATNMFPDTPIPPPLRLAKVPVLGWLFFRLAFGTLGLMAMWLAAVADRRAFPCKRYRAALKGHGVRTTRRIFLSSMRDLPGLYGEVERLGRTLGLPSLVLWGDRDPFFPRAVGERTAKALGAELRILPGCGHFVPEERPTETADAIAELIARSGS
ncbi:MAG: alpha/beta hydrolase [Myxococcales bacterium]|nr:alpha/beta hydrolase [Myxococcales bacterium]